MTELDIVNLDMYLAGVIHDALLEFKRKINKGTILYSHVWEEHGQDWDADENVSNDTEWFLNELIWTFDHLRDDGSISESRKLFEKIGDGLIGTDGTTTARMLSFVDDVQHHPDYPRYQELQRQEDERAKKGLMLFAKYFRHLWC
jgi:hypothetical protein